MTNGDMDAATKSVGLDEPRSVSFEVRRWDVLDVLRREADARTVLQIITPTTSSDLAGHPELARFQSMTTLTYASPLQREVIGWAAPLPTLDELALNARRAGLRADIVFIDPWHTYADSCAALLLALDLVNAGGHVVVHDCDPPDPTLAEADPKSIPDAWSGETWRAFVDVTARLDEGWPWWTIDADYGIGMIAASTLTEQHRAALHEDRRLIPARLPADQAWQWLQVNRAETLRLQDVSIWKGRILHDPA